MSDRFLPLLHGPEVVIKIGTYDQEYRFPKHLLCSQSPYFAAMFSTGKFKEGLDQSATLEEMKDVVSIRSFEMLTQWIYTGHVIIGDLEPTDAISMCIEFARICRYVSSCWPRAGHGEAYQKCDVEELLTVTLYHTAACRVGSIVV